MAARLTLPEGCKREKEKIKGNGKGWSVKKGFPSNSQVLAFDNSSSSSKLARFTGETVSSPPPPQHLRTPSRPFPPPPPLPKPIGTHDHVITPVLLGNLYSHKPPGTHLDFDGAGCCVRLDVICINIYANSGAGQQVLKEKANADCT